MSRFLLFIILVFSCSNPSGKDALMQKTLPMVTEVTVFPSEYGGFGYDISVNGKLFVHQPNIPAFTGNKGFPTEQSARKVANVVIKKINENQIPPALTIDEVIESMVN